MTVRALPGDIPSVLQLDVSELEIGQHEVVGSLTAPEGVVIVDDPETVVATVLPPRVEAVTAEEEEEELLEEPEVIGEGEAEAEPEE